MVEYKGIDLELLQPDEVPDRQVGYRHWATMLAMNGIDFALKFRVAEPARKLHRGYTFNGSVNDAGNTNATHASPRGDMITRNVALVGVSRGFDLQIPRFNENGRPDADWPEFATHAEFQASTPSPQSRSRVRDPGIP